MQRKIIPDAENRLLILYALKTVGAMTDQQLLIVMTDTDLMNYITLQLTIADLESEGKLRRQGDTAGGTLELTDAGRYLLNSFEMHIPVSRRGLIDSGAAQWRERFAAEQMAAVEIFDLPNGEKGLHLRRNRSCWGSIYEGDWKYYRRLAEADRKPKGLLQRILGR